MFTGKCKVLTGIIRNTNRIEQSALRVLETHRIGKTAKFSQLVNNSHLFDTPIKHYLIRNNDQT